MLLWLADSGGAYRWLWFEVELPYAFARFVLRFSGFTICQAKHGPSSSAEYVFSELRQMLNARSPPPGRGWCDNFSAFGCIAMYLV